MNKIKRLVIVTLAIVALSSCKKYEEGPWLSLRSKTARITGNWSLTSGFVQSSSTRDGIYRTEYKDGVSIDYVTENDTSYSSKSTYDVSMNIAKDGYAVIHTNYDGSTNENKFLWNWIDVGSKKGGLSLESDQFKIEKLTNKELILSSTNYYKSNETVVDYFNDTTYYGSIESDDLYLVFEKK